MLALCSFMKDQMEADDFHVVAADETIAALWENCAAAKSELREQSTQVSRGRMHAREHPLLLCTCRNKHTSC